MIAFERCCLITLWRLHQKHLTARKQIGLCVAFSVFFLAFATFLISMANLESRYGVLVLKFKDKTVVYALCIPTYSLLTCALVFCYLRFAYFMAAEKNTCFKSKQLKPEEFPEGEENHSFSCNYIDSILYWYIASFCLFLDGRKQPELPESRTL